MEFDSGAFRSSPTIRYMQLVQQLTTTSSAAQLGEDFSYVAHDVHYGHDGQQCLVLLILLRGQPGQSPSTTTERSPCGVIINLTESRGSDIQSDKEMQAAIASDAQPLNEFLRHRSAYFTGPFQSVFFQENKDRLHEMRFTLLPPLHIPAGGLLLQTPNFASQCGLIIHFESKDPKSPIHPAIFPQVTAAIQSNAGPDFSMLTPTGLRSTESKAAEPFWYDVLLHKMRQKPPLAVPFYEEGSKLTQLTCFGAWSAIALQTSQKDPDKQYLIFANKMPDIEHAKHPMVRGGPALLALFRNYACYIDDSESKENRWRLTIVPPCSGNRFEYTICNGARPEPDKFPDKNYHDVWRPRGLVARPNSIFVLGEHDLNLFAPRKPVEQSDSWADDKKKCVYQIHLLPGKQFRIHVSWSSAQSMVNVQKIEDLADSQRTRQTEPDKGLRTILSSQGPVQVLKMLALRLQYDFYRYVFCVFSIHLTFAIDNNNEWKMKLK